VKVLIVDDEASQRSGLAAMLSAWHMTPETAADGEEALSKLAEFPADVIITDLNMPGLDGFGLLQRLRDAGDSTPAIVLTAFGNIEKAVQTVHELGAYWFLDKPIQPGVLEVLIRRAGSHAGLLADKRNLERQLSYKGSLGNLVGTSPKMQEIFSLLQQAAPSKACVLITGESGTGKELVARTVHALSPRRQGPFIAINCAALPETLIESELFGHEKGSFTGANERRPGCFEIAQHGTLLLDEIGEMPMQTQAKLLRILEDSRVRRLGGKTEFEVDVRVVAATNKVPEDAVSGGHLREDLFYRRRHLPAFLSNGATVIAGPGIHAVAAPAHDDDDSVRFAVGTTVEEAEKGLIIRTLEHTKNNKTRAAEILGISLKTLHNKLKEYGGAKEEEAGA
jgi:DNA-binding NtrC family response regulator